MRMGKVIEEHDEKRDENGNVVSRSLYRKAEPLSSESIAIYEFDRAYKYLEIGILCRDGAWRTIAQIDMEEQLNLNTAPNPLIQISYTS